MEHTNLIGKPWHSGARGPDAFDCWGLAMYWLKHTIGIELPESPVNPLDIKAVCQEIDSVSSKPVWLEETLGEEGQIVLMGKNTRVSHVGVHVGGGFVLHCSRESGGVVLQTYSQLQCSWGTIKIYRYIG